MSERTVDAVVGATSNTSNAPKVQFSALDPAAKRARVVEVMERGLVGERMRVDLPDNMYGEWVHNSPEEIYRLQTLGFVIDDKYATRRALHSEGDGKSIVGDVVFMVCDKETKDLIDSVKREQFERIHGKPGSTRGKGEEKEFTSSLAATTPLGVINESRTDSVSLGEIAQSVNAGNS